MKATPITVPERLSIQGQKDRHTRGHITTSWANLNGMKMSAETSHNSHTHIMPAIERTNLYVKVTMHPDICSETGINNAMDNSQTAI